jgi:hypothetical protein
LGRWNKRELSAAELRRGARALRGLRGGRGDERFDGGKIVQQIFRNAVTMLQERQAVVGEPDLALAILPDKNFEWKVERGGRSGEHDRRAGFGAAENEQLGGQHGHADFGGFAAVVDEREEHHAFGLQNEF